MSSFPEGYAEQYYADVERDFWEDDYFDVFYLEKHYSGAPDECSRHYPEKLVNGECRICESEND